jgi:hypothetical protein
MRTDQLVRALAADNQSRTMPPTRALCCALVPATMVAIGLFLATLGLRPQVLALLAEEPRFAFKIAVAGLLAVAACVLASRLARPAGDARRAALLVAGVPILLAAADLAELVTVPAAEWGSRLVGSNALVCLRSIPLLAAAPLLAALLALRHGAPDNPTLAGASAGLLAGGIGAALYASHCIDDSPFFVSVWYTLAIAIVVAIGAWCGSRCLRW